MQKQKFEVLEEKFPDTLILQMQGNFYKAFNNSAFVLSGLMNYKLRPTKSGYKCGFPIITYEKVKEACNLHKINYVAFDGDKLVDQNSFKNNSFCEFCKINKPSEEMAANICVKKDASNTDLSEQQITVFEGYGINITNALGDLKEKIRNDILMKGFRVESLFVIKERITKNSILLHGIVIYK